MLHLERGPDGAAGVVENDTWDDRREALAARAGVEATELRRFQSLLVALAEHLATFPSRYLEEMRSDPGGRLALVREVHRRVLEMFEYGGSSPASWAYPFREACGRERILSLYYSRVERLIVEEELERHIGARIRTPEEIHLYFHQLLFPSDHLDSRSHLVPEESIELCMFVLPLDLPGERWRPNEEHNQNLRALIRGTRAPGMPTLLDYAPAIVTLTEAKASPSPNAAVLARAVEEGCTLVSKISRIALFEHDRAFLESGYLGQLYCHVAPRVLAAIGGDGAVEGNLEMAYRRLLAISTDVEALRNREKRRTHAVSSRCRLFERLLGRTEPASMVDYLAFRSMVRARARRMSVAVAPIRHEVPGGPAVDDSFEEGVREGL